MSRQRDVEMDSFIEEEDRGGPTHFVVNSPRVVGPRHGGPSSWPQWLPKGRKLILSVVVLVVLIGIVLITTELILASNKQTISADGRPEAKWIEDWAKYSSNNIAVYMDQGVADITHQFYNYACGGMSPTDPNQIKQTKNHTAQLLDGIINRGWPIITPFYKRCGNLSHAMDDAGFKQHITDLDEFTKKNVAAKNVSLIFAQLFEEELYGSEVFWKVSVQLHEKKNILRLGLPQKLEEAYNTQIISDLLSGWCNTYKGSILTQGCSNVSDTAQFITGTYKKLLSSAPADASEEFLSFSDFNKAYPDYMVILENHGVKDGNIAIYSKKYLDEVTSVIKDSSIENLSAYILYSFLTSSIYYDLDFNHTGNSRVVACIDLVTQTFPSYTTHLYALDREREWFSVDGTFARRSAEDVIRMVMKKLNKGNSTSSSVGAPEYYSDLNLPNISIPLDTTNLYETTRQFNLIDILTQKNTIGQETFNPWLVEDGVMPEAKYYPQTNELLVKFGLLTPPLFDKSNLFIINFARLGSIVATTLVGNNATRGAQIAKQAYDEYKNSDLAAIQITKAETIVEKWDAYDKGIYTTLSNGTRVLTGRRATRQLDNLEQVFWITWAQTYCNTPNGKQIVDSAITIPEFIDAKFPTSSNPST
eukprot:TRINITY_DN386_c0_g1_i1.p1 TRINITY_DN386_c0_g1~~TRINITY_DN386_c0_g1_i1.p1  ORF type:complete len:646 (+),score=96.00 TRINITY_DN386_c0_g1_i1:57-1994(+)